jgi:hypothetical protein
MHRGLALLVLVVTVVALLYVPVQIPFDLVTVGHVQPAATWRLSQDGAGNLVSTQHNYRDGQVDRLGSWQFNRGDLAGMEVCAKADSLGFVGVGDTLVRMYSNMVQQQILELETQIRVLEAERLVLTTGEKPETVREAEAQLQFAREALTLREKELSIADELYKNGAAAELEYKTRLNARDLAVLEVNNRARVVEVVATGVKPESVDFNVSQTAALRQRLALLRAQVGGYAIKSPFMGVLAPTTDPAEVLILHNIQSYIVKIPIKTEDLQYLSDSTRYDIVDAQTGIIHKGRFLRRMQETALVSDRHVGFVQVEVIPQHPTERLSIGLTGRCKIHCGYLNQREYIKRLLHFTIER